MRFSRTASIAVAVVLSMGVAACSPSEKDDASKKSDSTKSGGEPATRTTRGVTDTSIKVGGVQYNLFFGEGELGAKARFKKANDAGGVHGRMIEFVGADNDGGQATEGLAITQRLVDQEQVFAMVPVLTPDFGGQDHVIANDVPMFGWGINPAFCGPEMSFGITGCVTDPKLEIGSNALGTGLLEHFGGDAGHTIAFVGDDNDGGRGGLLLLSASVENKGFDVVLTDSSIPPPPDPLGDPSAIVSKVMTSASGAQPDVVYLQTTINAVALTAAIQAAGFKGMIITPSYSPLLLGRPGYNDIYINTQISMDPDLDANKEMLDAVHAIEPDAKLSLSMAAGYWAADMFIDALDKTGKDLTVEKLLATLNGGDFTFEVPGVVGPSTWPANHSKPVPCSVFTKVEDNAFVPYMPLQCGENIEIHR